MQCLTAGSCTVEENAYGIAVGFATYGPSLTQVPPVHTSDRPGFGRSATSVVEGYGGIRQGSTNKGNSLEQELRTYPVHRRGMAQQADTSNRAYSETGCM